MVIRGMFTFNGVLHAVRDDELLSIDSAGAVTVVANIGSAGGPVDMCQNLTQLIIGDGAQLYVWDGVTLTTISDYAVGNSVTFIDQRIVFPLANSQGFQWTSLGDAAVINPLDFASAEGSPDKIVSIVANMRELLILGEESGEVWHSVGGSTVFERSPSEYLQVGCVAPRSLVVCNDTPIWLGRTADGQAQVMGGRGQRISTRAIEERFVGDLFSARAYSMSVGASCFYCLNVPGADTTLCFDLTYKQWHERAELVNGDYQQWRPTCHAFAYGNHYFGSGDGAIYVGDRTVSNFAGSPMCRERVAPVLSAPDMRLLRFPALEVLAQKATTGIVNLRYSDDNGYTWSSWRQSSAGAIGEYKTRMNFWRMGSARDRVFQVRMTDDAPWNPVSCFVDVR